ncbi:MAG: right-handed parallel beta-helix repeat-containing protein [Bacteroidota bacterium]
MKQYFYSFSLLALLASTIPFVVNTHSTNSLSVDNMMTGCDNGRIYVDANAGGTEDGETWGNAYTKLQDALDEACACGNPVEIWVAQGTYYPDEGMTPTPNDRSSTFQLCNNVALYGGFSGAGTETLLSERDFENNVTILSGDLQQNDSQQPIVTDIATLTSNDDNAYNVVTGSGTDNTAILDGFTITGGNANDDFSVPDNVGAGMYNENGSPTISNSVFSGNNAFIFGGGMFNSAGSSPTISNSVFSGNNAISDGGGMFNDNSSPTISNSVFSGNNATNGGGMFNTLNSSPTISNSVFSGNIATFGGGCLITKIPRRRSAIPSFGTIRQMELRRLLVHPFRILMMVPFLRYPTRSSPTPVGVTVGIQP